MAALSKGGKAPSFELPGVDGKTYSPDNLSKGDLAVVAFFKESCPVCHLAFPYLDKIFSNHKEDVNIRFFGVAQESRSGAKKFIQNFNLSMPVALDEDPYPVSRKYGLTNVPTVFVIDGEGKVVESLVGFDKKGYESVAARLAQASGTPQADVFKGASVPDFKPG